MRYINSVSALALAALPLTLAQTFSDCDPTKKADCPTKPGLNTAQYTADFTQGAAATSDWTTTSGTIDYVAEGGQFSIKALGEGPTMQTNFYMFFGYVEVVMKAAPGAGIVSSFVMESDDLDEIDWEMIGSDTTQVQSNYFGKGNTTTYDRGKFHPVTTPQNTMTTYAVNWTQETTTWLINGAPVRTLNFADAVGGQNYPQTPMNVRLGNWVAGAPGNSPGTVEWAGGLADFSKGPFDMFVQSVKIINYNPAASYKYSDMSGSWQSINALPDAPSAGKAASSDNSTTGPGAVPFNGEGSGAAASASIAAASSQNLAQAAAPTVVTITTGAASLVTGAANLNGSNPMAQAAAAASGGTTYTINTAGAGAQGAQAAATGGASFSNSTSGAGGLVAQGVPAGSNATNPTVTINTGGSGSSQATGAPAGAQASGTLTTATAGNAQSFGLGTQGASSARTSGPAQVTANPGYRVQVPGFAAALGVVGLGMVLV